MGNTRLGSGYVDSGCLLQTVKINTEIMTKQCYSFTFVNSEPCHFIVNGGVTFYRNAGEGFEMSSEDAILHSLVIVENGIHYKFSGAY